MKKILLALALTVTLNSSFASALTARVLNELCFNNDSGSTLSCSTYILGFIEGVEVGQHEEFSGKNGSVGTIRNVFKKEMRLHPEKGDERSQVVLSQLLKKHGWLVSR